MAWTEHITAFFGKVQILGGDSILALDAGDVLTLNPGTNLGLAQDGVDPLQINMSLDNLTGFSTDDLAEGTNEYFTVEKAQDAVGAMLVSTDSITFTYTDATPELKADVNVDDSTVEVAVGIGVRVKDDGITVDKLAHDIDATGIGFNADQVDGKDVNDTLDTTAVLWTASKIKSYVDTSINGLDWQESVINSNTTDPSGLSPSDGDRYLVPASATGDWSGQDEKIAEYNGSSWDFVVPDEGTAVFVESEDKAYIYNGTHPGGSWVPFSSIVSHNTLNGLQGGTTSEFYHLTNAQHSALTDAGGVVDASSQHIHDDRYYTETETDTLLDGKADTVSGTADNIATLVGDGQLQDSGVAIGDVPLKGGPPYYVTSGMFMGVNKPPDKAYQGPVALWSWKSNPPQEQLYFSQLLSNLTASTNLVVDLYQFCLADVVGDYVVRWGIEYVVTAHGDDVDAKTPTVVEANVSLPTDISSGQKVVSQALMTLSHNDANNPLVNGRELHLRIYRDAGDAADTLSEDFGLTQMVLRHP